LAGWQLSGSTPLSRSDKLLQIGQQHNKLQEKGKTMSTGAMDEDIDEVFFETTVLSFMKSLNLQDKDLDNIQLIAVRKKLEQTQGRELSPQERRIFIAVVKKYVMSLKDTKSNSVIKSQHLNQSINTDDCSKEESVKRKELTTSVSLPHHNYGVKKEQISEKECARNNNRDGTGWLNTKGDYCTDASTSRTNSYVGQSPTVRRNLISLEDSDCTHEALPYAREVNDELVGGDRCFRNDDSRETSVRVTQQKAKKMLKRKSSQIGGASKRYHTLDCDELDITDDCDISEFKEVNPDSEHSTGENLVQCPVCGGKFTFKVFIFIHNISS
jgi:hypothetical protein